MPRRLVALVSAVVFVDTMFYAVVAPLLPSLSDDLGLSKAAAGVLAAAYPAGTLLGSLPAGLLASRAGPRTTVLFGLGLLAASTLVFGFAHHVVILDAARFVQGIGGACSWAGALAWLIAEAPEDRRGALIGTALGWAIGGELFGPVVGALADVTSHAAAFSTVVVFALALVLWALSMPATHAPSDQRLGDVVRVLRRPTLWLPMWLVTLPAIAFGIVTVIGPLRLDGFGFSAAAVGAVFLVAAAAEGLVSPIVGRVSDRRGRRTPIRCGLVGSAAMLLLVTVPGTGVLLGAVVVLLAAALGLFWAPAMAWMTELAEHAGLTLGFAFALTNLAWAGGQVAGAGLGGALAAAVDDALPCALAAAASIATLVALRRDG